VFSRMVRLVFNSSRAGNRNLWTMRLDGTDARPLTFGPWNDDRPAFSPDGLQVAFVSDRDGQRGIWLVSRDGGSPRKLINAETLGALSWSPDSSRIVYAAGTSEWPGLWTVSVADGSREPFHAGSASEPAWSPTRDRLCLRQPVVRRSPSWRFSTAGKAAHNFHHHRRNSAQASGLAHRLIYRPASGGRYQRLRTGDDLDRRSDARAPYRKLLNCPPDRVSRRYMDARRLDVDYRQARHHERYRSPRPDSLIARWRLGRSIPDVGRAVRSAGADRHASIMWSHAVIWFFEDLTARLSCLARVIFASSPAA
jgi:hypothetical protein